MLLEEMSDPGLGAGKAQDEPGESCNIISFPKNSISSVIKDLVPYMGFGGGRGAAPAGLNLGGGVRSFRASRERFLTTLL